MVGIYFSGTGYTKYCVGCFVKHIDSNNKAVSIESPETLRLIEEQDTIVFGYPIYFSRLPGIVKEFIIKNKAAFKDKKFFIISAQGIFSKDDSAFCAAKLFRKYGGKVIGGLHLLMPNNTGDDKRYLNNADVCLQKIKRAEEKILIAANKFKVGKPAREGLLLHRRFIGFFMRWIQKLWFYGKAGEFMKMPNVNEESCTGCGVCEKFCPMQNMSIVEGKAVSGDRCTLCYRCVNSCPAKALTILGKEVYEQNRFNGKKV